MEVNGIDYSRLLLKHLGDSVYYVSPKDVILLGTLKENVTLGKDIIDEDVTKVLEIADVDFARSLDKRMAPEALSDDKRQEPTLATQ